ncbi:hypothetical protein G6F22_019197 [Rhizopus arrhizus]|nr:hypothetical protein G6F22_019197 [Rhizopus arrhizus]
MTVDVAAGIQASARQIVHELPVFGLPRPERRDQAACAIGQLRTAAAFAAGRSHDEGLARQVVHGVDGVPGSLVAHAHGARGSRDGARGGNLRQQVYAVLSAPGLGAGTKPDRAV